MKKFLYGFMRIFLFVTGFIPYLLFMRPKWLFTSDKAEKDFKKHKKGVLYISNHTKVLDYYAFMFKRFPHHVHAFVAEVAVKSKFLQFLNNVVGNIKVDRTTKTNISPISQAINYLDNNKIVLIFPEGKMEENPGNLEDFKKTFAYLSLETGKPIIPFYNNGTYGIFKRPVVAVGEAIYPKELNGEAVNDEDIDELTKQTVSAIRKIGKMARDSYAVKTKQILTFKYWLMDFIKWTSYPIFFLIFPIKRYFIGNRKNIKKAMKYNVLLCSNHCGMCDAVYMILYHPFRRVRILTAEEVFASNFLNFVLTNSGMIKYHRLNNDAFDLVAFKECVTTLSGRGAVVVFPEGHINFDGEFDKQIKAGAAAMSIMTDTPIVPIIFVTPFKYFRFTKILYGEPIYPSDYSDKLVGTSAEKINIFNDIIYSKMKELYDNALTKRPKNFDKDSYFHDKNQRSEINKGDQNEQAR